MLEPQTIQRSLLRHGFTFNGTHCFNVTAPARVLAAAAVPT